MELRKRRRLAAVVLRLAFWAPSSASFPLSGHSDSVRWVRAAQLGGAGHGGANPRAEARLGPLESTQARCFGSHGGLLGYLLKQGRCALPKDPHRLHWGSRMLLGVAGEKGTMTNSSLVLATLELSLLLVISR